LIFIALIEQMHFFESGNSIQRKLFQKTKKERFTFQIPSLRI